MRDEAATWSGSRRRSVPATLGVLRWSMNVNGKWSTSSDVCSIFRLTWPISPAGRSKPDRSRASDAAGSDWLWAQESDGLPTADSPVHSTLSGNVRETAAEKSGIAGKQSLGRIVVCRLCSRRRRLKDSEDGRNGKESLRRVFGSGDGYARLPATNFY